MKFQLNVLAIAALATANTPASAQVDTGDSSPSYTLNGTYNLDPTKDPVEIDTIMGIIYDHIKNRYKDSAYWSFGSSASMGDFDGDGDIDIAIGINFARTPISVVPHVTSDLNPSVSGAGAVCVLYGPISDWTKRIGEESDENLAIPSNVGWFNAFDFADIENSDTDGTGAPSNMESLMIWGDVGRMSIAPGDSNGVSLNSGDNLIIKLQLLKTDESGAKNAFNAGPSDSAKTWIAPDGDSEKQDGDGLGYAVSFAGDVDNDGADDLLIGAPSFNREDERGDDKLFQQHFEGGVEYSDGAVISGPGAPKEIRAKQTSFGAAFLVFGDAGEDSRLTGEYFIRDIGRIDDPENDYTLDGVRFIGATMHDKLGQDVRNASLPALEDEHGVQVFARDIDRDYYADFVIASQTFDSGDHPAHSATSHIKADTNPDTSDVGQRDDGIGACYIIYGADRTKWKSAYHLPNDIIPSANGGKQGLEDEGMPDHKGAVIYGSAYSGYLSYAGYAGDFDGNDCADVIIGNPFADADGDNSNSSNTGAAYIIFGYEGSLAPKGEYFVGGWEGVDPAGMAYDWGEPLYKRVVDDSGSKYPVALRLVGGVNSVDDYPTYPTFPAWPSPIPHHDFPAWSNIQTQVNNDQMGSAMGWTVMAAGDVNLDGKADVLIGAPCFSFGDESDDGWNKNAQPDGSGRTYLVYGFDPREASFDDNSTQWKNTQLSNLVDRDFASVEIDKLVNNDSTITDAAVFYGENIGDNFGWHVFCAGDVNADGYADFLIGANEADVPVDHDDDGAVDYLAPTTGAAYLIYGQPNSNKLDGKLFADDIGTTIAGAKFYGDVYWSEGQPHWGLDVWHSDIYEKKSFKPALGTWVFGGLDLNGDGYSDFGLCARKATMPYDDVDETKLSSKPRHQGAVYMVYGNSLHMADFNNDGLITTYDVNYYNVLKANGNAPDLTHDGVVDSADVNYLMTFVN